MVIGAITVATAHTAPNINLKKAVPCGLSKEAFKPIVGKWSTYAKKDGIAVAGIVDYAADGTNSFEMRAQHRESGLVITGKVTGVWKRKGRLLAESSGEWDQFQVEVAGLPTDMKAVAEETREKIQEEMRKISLYVLTATPKAGEINSADHPSSQTMDKGDEPMRVRWRRIRSTGKGS
jgi:hypothetical protein